MTNMTCFSLLAVVHCIKDIVTEPSNGNVSCNHSYGDFAYGSTCHYSCKEGYKPSRSQPLMCTASGQWSQQPPTCDREYELHLHRASHLSMQYNHKKKVGPICVFPLFRSPSVVKCLELQQPTRGSIRCSDPQGPSSYGSTCEFACDEGYTLVGSSTLQCGASGLWSSLQPLCVGMSASTGVKNPKGLHHLGGEDRKVSHTDLFRFSPLQPSSALSFTGWSTATSAAERTWTPGSAMEAPAASPVAPATFWQGRAR